MVVLFGLAVVISVVLLVEVVVTVVVVIGVVVVVVVVVGVVEIKKFHSDSTKNTSLGNHFRFVIFSLFQFVSFRNT